jgi:hypothetical protein
MKTVTETRTVYTFAELSESAKESAITQYSIDLDDHWSECTIDDLKESANMLGIAADSIYFSGFSYQGDGACFTGSYEYKKGALKTIKSEYPQWTELHQIAEQLQLIQKRAFYRLSVRVTHSGHYNHEGCTSIEVFNDGDYLSEAMEDTGKDLSEALRDFMRLCYSSLEKSYNYEVSEENVAEMSAANEWTYLENGEMYNV